MSRKNFSLLGISFLFCFLYFTNTAKAACGGALPSSSCDDSGHTLSTGASPWPRAATLSNSSGFGNCIGDSCTATSCTTSGSVTSAFGAIGMSSSAVGPSRILSWTCSATACNCPAGDSHYACWCTDYDANSGYPSCSASSSIATFSDTASSPIYNLPVSVISGNWNYCGPENPSITNPINPLPAGDPRTRSNACSWTARPAGNCGSIQAIDYNISDGTKTFACVSRDMDGGYDNYSYSFKMKEIGSANPEIECLAGAWNNTSGGYCRKTGPGTNQVYFRSTDPRAQYQMTCTVSDGVGSTDYSYNLIRVGSADAVSCAMYPSKIAVCSGESVSVTTETQPEAATVSWTCPTCPSSPSGVTKGFNLNFATASAGSKSVNMMVTSGADTGACTTAVNVLNSSCDAQVAAVAPATLGSLIPGSQVTITADRSCFSAAAGTPYLFSITKNGAAAVKSTDYRDIAGTTGAQQAASSVTIEIILPGQYGVNLTIQKDDGGTVSCSNEFLANTEATEWWERRP
jgi:hypothetical protein